MKVLVCGLGDSARIGRDIAAAFIPKALEQIGCTHVVTWDHGLVQQTAKAWAEQKRIPRTGYNLQQPPKPIDVLAWEITEQSRPDFALGFWPGKSSSKLLHLLKARGVLVATVRDLSLQWHSL